MCCRCHNVLCFSQGEQVRFAGKTPLLVSGMPPRVICSTVATLRKLLRTCVFFHPQNLFRDGAVLALRSRAAGSHLRIMDGQVQGTGGTGKYGEGWCRRIGRVGCTCISL